jgi:gamma-glutamyl phosphate reductase
MFLLSADLKTFADWIEQANNDDIKYALELAHIMQSELEIHEMNLHDIIEDFTEANLLIDRIKNV